MNNEFVKKQWNLLLIQFEDLKLSEEGKESKNLIVLGLI